MIANFWAAIKCAQVCLLFGSFLLFSEVLSWTMSQKYSQKYILALSPFVMRVLLKLVGISIHKKYWAQQLSSEKGILVANHLSYIDILVIQTICPSLFITSTDMTKNTIFGRFCRNSGCISVNRKSIWGIKNEISKINQLLASGFNVVLFPEATTTDSSCILPFRSSLLEAALACQKNIYPIVLSYTIEGKSLSHLNRDLICWYADMKMLPHIFNLCKTKSVAVNVEFLKPIQPQKFKSRKDVGRKAQEQIQYRIKLKATNDKRHFKKFFGNRVIWPSHDHKTFSMPL